jgi:ligand-binding SRPBCC domain-containing protein
MDTRTVVLERETRLDRPADEVWARVTTPTGINHELGPWLRMTIPGGWNGASLADVEAGARLGRSWVLLAAVMPIDYDDLGIDAIGDRYFRERSTMATARLWQHERWVERDEDDPDGACLVRDRIEYVPRRWLSAIPAAARAHQAILTTVFRHRHRRLVAWSAATTSAS